MDYYKYVSEHKLYDLFQDIMNCLDTEYNVRHNVELGLYFTYLVNEEELIYEKEFNRLCARA